MKTNFKKMVALFLSLVIIMSCMSVCAFAAGEKFTFSLKNGYAVLTSCSKKASGIVAVPSMATIDGNGYEVKYIGASAFEDCDKITRISIPEGITVIGSRAFAGCTSLRELYVPSTLASCQYDAFEGCSEVMVHCYSNNYQFFTVYGFSENIKINVVDSDSGSIDLGGNDSEITMTIFDVIKNFILKLLEYFGVDLNEDEEMLGEIVDKIEGLL